MPTVRVFLRCATPTNRASGLYDTFINVSDEGFSTGEHVRVAIERAAMLGYGAPHRVAEVRVLSLLGPAGEGARDTHGRDETRQRLLASIAAAQRDSASSISGDRGCAAAGSATPLRGRPRSAFP